MKIKLFALVVISIRFLSSCAQDEQYVGSDSLIFTTTLSEKSLHMTQSIVLAHAL